MIQHSVIKGTTYGLYGIVGWNQSTVADQPTVDAGNLGSTSGLKFNEAHPLVTIQNIYDTQEDTAISDAEFNTLLDHWQEDVIVRVCNSVFGADSRHMETKTLFPFERSFENTEDPGDGFLCIQMVMPLNRRFVYVINSVSLALDSAKTFNVKLYNSGVKAAIQTKSITTVADEETKTALGWIISPVGNTYPGGNFYLGYEESDLDGAKPYKRDYENANIYLDGRFCKEFQRIAVAGNEINFTDPTNLDQPFGLNIEWSVYTDWTDAIISNRQIFANAIYYGMTIKILQQIRSTTRSNIVQRLNEDFRGIADFELDGAKNSIMSQYDKAIEELKEHFFPRRQVIKGQFS